MKEDAMRRREMASHIMSTAAEGGIGYWCLLREYRWEDVPCGAYPNGLPKTRLHVYPLRGWEHNDADPSTVAERPIQFTVDDRLILSTLRKMRDGKGLKRADIPPHHRRLAACLLADPEGTDYDQGDADVIFQYAALGDVVYG